MEYKIIEKTKSGYISTRKPQEIREDLLIKFNNAPQGATAIFENDRGNTLYRLLENNTCKVPLPFLKSKCIKVALTVLDDSNSNPIYKCESINTQECRFCYLIFPEGFDIESSLIEVMSQNDELSKLILKNDKTTKELDQKLQKVLEGYDFD